MQTIQLRLTAPKQITMPVGKIDAAQIRKLCGVEKLREFDVAPTLGKCEVTQSKSWPYKGKFKTYPKYTNDAWITSFAVVSENMVTLHSALRTTITKLAPTGMKFATDSNGLHLVRASDGMDYHPTAEDFAAKDFSAHVRKGMAENHKRRLAMRRAENIAAKDAKEKARIEKIFAREMKTTRVTLADSRRAGNCVEGTLRFAEIKLKISREEVLAAAHLFSVPAPKLLAVANGDTDRVKAAIRVAWLRETTVSI